MFKDCEDYFIDLLITIQWGEMKCEVGWLWGWPTLTREGGTFITRTIRWQDTPNNWFH